MPSRKVLLDEDILEENVQHQLDADNDGKNNQQEQGKRPHARRGPYGERFDGLRYEQRVGLGREARARLG